MEKVVNGVTYVSEASNSCKGCAAAYDEDLCDALHGNPCFHIWTKNPEEQPINFYSNVNPPAPDNRPPVPSKPIQGVKYDSDKIKYSLLPSYALEAAAKNLTTGLKKYPERDNWQLVDNAQERYMDALYRHLEAHRKGEIFDTESSDETNTHLAAVVVNAMFLLEFLLNPKLNGENNGTI